MILRDDSDEAHADRAKILNLAVAYRAASDTGRATYFDELTKLVNEIANDPDAFRRTASVIHAGVLVSFAGLSLLGNPDLERFDDFEDAVHTIESALDELARKTEDDTPDP
jgi:hypothetical protein